MEKPVRSSFQYLSISYECALAIGNSLNLSEMLHKVIHTVVHKTNAHRGIIWVKNGEQELQPVASAGINIKGVLAQNEIMALRDVLNQILKRQQFVLRYKDDKDFLQYCPVLTEREETVLIVPVANVAILHLVFASRELADEPLANLLASLSKKLSVAIEACMAHEKIIKEIQVREKAENELTKKTEQLSSSKKELQRLYGESEQARKSLLSILEDVTQKEKALRESEEKFRLLAENSIDCIWMLDTRLRFTYISPASERLLGYKPEQMVGTKLSSHFKKREFLKAGALAARAIKDYKTFTHVTFETKMLNSKNEEVDMEISSKTLLDSQGKLIGLQGTTTDITERKEAEEEKRRHLQNITFLTETAMSFVEFPPDKDIYRFIGERLKELAGESIVMMSSINEDGDTFTTRAVLGMGKYSKGILKLIGGNPEGREYDISDVNLTHLSDVSNENLAHLYNGRLNDYEGKLYSFFLGKIPKPVCRAIEKLTHLSKIYAIGFVEGKRLFGTAAIFLSQGAELESEEVIETFITQASIAIQRQLAQQSLQRRHRELALLNRVIVAASTTLEPKVVLETTCRELALAFDVPQAAAALLNETRTASVVVAEYLAEGYPSALDVVIPLEGNPATQYVVEYKAPLFIANAQHDPSMAAIHEVMRQRGTVSLLILPLMVRGQVVGTLGLDAVERCEFSEEDITLAANAVAAAAQALENARLYQMEHRRRSEAELLREAARVVSSSLEVEEILRLILTQLKRALVYTAASVLILREDNIPELIVGSGYADETLTSQEVQNSLRTSPILRQMARDLQPVVSTDVRELEGWVFVPGAEHIRAWLGIPLIVRGRMTGALMVDSDQPDFFGEADVQITQSLAQLAAQAIENARLFSQANQRLKRMGALHAIDKAISASVNINLTTEVFLDQVLTHLDVDAADILLFDPIMHTLECIGRKGFRTSALEHTHLHLGQGLAGQVALQREIKHVPDLQEEEEVFLASPNLSGEEFVAYYGVPLVAKGALKGVLEIFHRAPLSSDDEWLTFLNALASQAAIAIDNASMFTDLQRSNLALGMAYDSTLEGWAKALELKDVETEGHSHRVVYLTMQLASQMGIGEKELVHIRRGALLHDIGKMGVPDSILNKPCPLDEEEWAIMHQHPVYARDMLAPIEYLRPALDIPYSHHEKWDGSGYPEGLRGEEIPLAARIFAIVDVWDALNSDRPYRDAWPEEKALNYIQEQSGKYFDPNVVEAFLELIDSE